jgi:hypothetical protein
MLSPQKVTKGPPNEEGLSVKLEPLEQTASYWVGRDK